jgi:hypothetical protein
MEQRVMKQVLAIALMFTLVAGLDPLLASQAPVVAGGVIQGTLSGDSGPLAGVTINIIDFDAQVVRRTTRTGLDGTFTTNNLTVGRYFVQAVSPSGAVLSTVIATLTGDNTVATVRMIATDGNDRRVVSGSAAKVGSFRVIALTAAISAAATAAGVAGIVGTRDDASPSK